jgi:hypothetical protein
MNKIEEIFTAWGIAFNPNDKQAELAAMRMQVCDGCEYKRTTGINRCALCGCALKAKVYSQVESACPDGRWSIIDRDYFKQKAMERIKKNMEERDKLKNNTNE